MPLSGSAREASVCRMDRWRRGVGPPRGGMGAKPPSRTGRRPKGTPEGRAGDDWSPVAMVAGRFRWEHTKRTPRSPTRRTGEAGLTRRFNGIDALAQPVSFHELHEVRTIHAPLSGRLPNVAGALLQQALDVAALEVVHGDALRLAVGQVQGVIRA